MKNEDEECFRWCHIRHLNPQTKYPERIKKEDKKMINELNYDGIIFPLSQNTTIKSKNRTASESMCLVMKMDNHFPFTSRSKETFEDQMNLLLITKKKRSTTSS